MSKYEKCEIWYDNKLIGIASMEDRYEVLDRAMQDGTIVMPFRSYKLEFRFIENMVGWQRGPMQPPAKRYPRQFESDPNLQT